jgi:hypothetical protein
MPAVLDEQGRGGQRCGAGDYERAATPLVVTLTRRDTPMKSTCDVPLMTVARRV